MSKKKHPKDRAERRRLSSLKDLGEAFKIGETHAVSVPNKDAKEELRSRQEEHELKSVQGSSDPVPNGGENDQRRDR